MEGFKYTNLQDEDHNKKRSKSADHANVCFNRSTAAQEAENENDQTNCNNEELGLREFMFTVWEELSVITVNVRTENNKSEPNQPEDEIKRE